MSRQPDSSNNLSRQFERLQQQFEDMMAAWEGDQLGVPGAGFAASRMDVDLVDQGEEFVLRADLPGFQSEDIEVRLVGDSVEITADGETTQEERGDEEDAIYVKQERTRRRTSRTVGLPEPVEESGVEAAHENGVLTVVLPKEGHSEDDGKRIDIL